ncbi:MAG TPA: FIST C-terminal domain-containing protein, partial [Rhodospirillales bacterium]|nr:FIST C-terminal domain-containing protein [Rhodospirillales bacterium]
MKVASSLVSGLYPTPDLAAEAVRNALQDAGLQRADSVLLFLTRDYVRHAQPAIVAAARAAGTLQVSGCTAFGLLTERGWLLDQPGAVALVLTHSATATDDMQREPLLSFSGQHSLPYAWQAMPERAGLLDAEAVSWSHGRVAEQPGAEIRLSGVHTRLCLSPGLRRLNLPLTVNAAAGYDLRQLGGLTPLDSLRRHLPAELRAEPPLHQIVVTRTPSRQGTCFAAQAMGPFAGDEPGAPAIPILNTNADGSLTLAEPLAIGEQVHWAIRQPLSAEQDMRQSLLAAPQRDFLRGAADPEKRPDFALMFSCLGRGPLFYGNDDRDLLVFREQFPDVPLIGAYGSGQIAPAGG